MDQEDARYVSGGLFVVGGIVVAATVMGFVASTARAASFTLFVLGAGLLAAVALEHDRRYQAGAYGLGAVGFLAFLVSVFALTTPMTYVGAGLVLAGGVLFAVEAAGFVDSADPRGQ